MTSAPARIVSITAIVLLLSSPVLAANQPAMTEQQLTDAIARLKWLQAGAHRLPLSNSTLALPQGYHMVLGEGAKQMFVLSGNPADNSVEAIAISPDFKHEIVFQSVTEGYISLDDWDSVSPSEMINGVRINTDNVNEERRRQGIDEIHVVDWIQQPTLDRTTNTVYWSIEGSTTRGPIVNSIALRFGRNGYERLNWIADKADYVPIDGQLDVMLRAQGFNPGYRYSDHEPSDRAALYGIAGLVAAIAAAKAVKVAAGTGLAALLKKFGVIGFAAVAAVLFRLKNLFRRKPYAKTPQSPST